MRHLTLTIVLLPFLAMASEEVVRLSDPVEVRDGYEIFGAPMATLEGGFSLGHLIASGTSDPALVQTEVVQVCQKKGCFFMARDGEHVARVKFVDYGFFVPTDSAGKNVILTGTLQRQQLSPERQAHYAEDAGAGAVSDEPVMEYTILASSVAVPAG